MDSALDYVQLVQEPWGKIFYDLLFTQLDLPQTPRLKILDFGSGLGVTSNHYAKWHEVTAIEPNEEMIENKRKENPYTIIHGGMESLTAYKNNYFDIVLCHNVLEYAEEKEPIIAALMGVLKPKDLLSLVKHNRVGRVFQTAVFKNDPKKALSLLDNSSNDKSVKYDAEWYQNMIALETAVADIDEYKKAAFLNHLIVNKR